VFPDGQHFIVQRANEEPFHELAIVVNWLSLLKP